MESFLQLLDVSKLLTAAVEFIPRLVAAIAMFAAFWIAFRVTRGPIKAALLHTDFHEKLVELVVDNVYRYVLLIFGIVMALDQLGVNVGAALAGIGVAGIAIGFAAQDSISNVIAGFLIFWDKPFIVGSWIEVEGEFGQVTNITLRTTRIRTNRNTYVVIPNKNIIDTRLENYSKHGEVRIDVPIGIAYKENVPRAREVLLEAVRGIPQIRTDPAPDVVVDSLGDSSVNLLVRVWIDDPARLPAASAVVVEAGKLALDEAGIEIPFPHLQLFVENVEDRVWKRLEPVLGGGGAGRAA